MKTDPWTARELALTLLLFPGVPRVPPSSQTLADWWNDRTATRSRKWWAKRFNQSHARTFALSNFGKAIARAGIEPTLENYRHLVNAARKRHMPRSKPI
jgi:hypothetical protein